MKKITGIVSCVVLVLAACYLGESFSAGNGYRGEHRDKVSVSIVGEGEKLEPSGTFVERKNTFTYEQRQLEYLLIFPAQYTQTAERWPLVLFLHGSSLRGNNIEKVKEYGPTWVAEQEPDFPMVVLAPQCPENENWDDKAELLAAMLEDVVKKHRIDPQRVYLTGMSLGGRGAWVLAGRHPECFAAVAPVAAAEPAPPDVWSPQLVSLPVWAFHGARDEVAPVACVQGIVEEMKRRGGNPRFTVLPGQGHSIAGIYKNHELYDWLLQQARHDG